MGMNKLNSLLWEHIPFENFILYGAKITHENMDEVLWDEVDELKAFRDENYNISISCTRYINRHKSTKANKSTSDKKVVAGEGVSAGKISINISSDYIVEFSPCYCNGYESKIDKTNYLISCYHIEGKSITKNHRMIKEWIINGNPRGLRFCDNQKFEYIVEGTISGKYGDKEFPTKELVPEYEYQGRFMHVKYKDTAFDIHYPGDNYGPAWSTNLSISYCEDYGRIPSEEERKIIRDYLSFFVGKRLIYIGESLYDENGNAIGFVMEAPRTFGMDLKRTCLNAAKPPFSQEYKNLKPYFANFEKYIDAFAELYSKLDFETFFTLYWYAKEIAKPMDLPILSSALENLKRKWYEEVELNPETVLMDKKDFAKRIKPIKELVQTQFEGTEYMERIKRSVEGMNRMSVSEQLAHFFEAIDMIIGNTEKNALRARNFSAHGSLGRSDADYQEQYMMSQVYECIIVRVILKLLKYDGNYVDYGTLGFPEKHINHPSGSESVENR